MNMHGGCTGKLHDMARSERPRCPSCGVAETEHHKDDCPLKPLPGYSELVLPTTDAARPKRPHWSERKQLVPLGAVAAPSGATMLEFSIEDLTPTTAQDYPPPIPVRALTEEEIAAFWPFSPQRRYTAAYLAAFCEKNGLVLIQEE